MSMSTQEIVSRIRRCAQECADEAVAQIASDQGITLASPMRGDWEVYDDLIDELRDTEAICDEMKNRGAVAFEREYAVRLNEYRLGMRNRPEKR